MKTTRTAPATFTIEFESEDELREEHRTNLSMQGLRVPTEEAIALYTPVVVTLRGVGGGEVVVKGVVVAALPGGVALSIEGNADEILEKLLAEEKPQSAWDRMRGLTQVEKILLAVKADRSERALLMQDSDPRAVEKVLRILYCFDG